MRLNSNKEVRQLAKRSKKEELENNFFTHFVLLFPQLPEPARQYKVRNPKTGRDWKLDFAWVFSETEKYYVELQGGAYLPSSGHNTARGQHDDYERHNFLARHNWKSHYFNTVACQNMAQVAEDVAEFICNAHEVPDGRSKETTG